VYKRQDVDYLFTGDGVINSYFLELDNGVKVISNSPGAVETIIKTSGKQHPSMADASDFKYMRSIYPADEKKEDAFIYLSDKFIRRLVGPALRIKEARRMEEALRMARLDKYILYHYHLTGKLPSSVNDIYKIINNSEKNNKDVLNDSFRNLSVNKKSFNSFSSHYGRYGYMKSNNDTEIKLVSKNEAELYNRFVGEYNSFWNEYFDPIGIRIKMDKGIKVETCILPLINNSIYNTLAIICGGSPVSLNPENSVNGEILSLAFKLNKSMIPGIDELNYHALSGNFLSLFKDEFQIHMHDTMPLIDFDSKILAEHLFRGRFKSDKLFIGIFGWSLFHPLRVTLPLKDPERSDEVIRGLDRLISGLFSGSDINIKRYSYEFKASKIRVIKLNFFGAATVRLYYSVKNGALHITSTKSYIEKFVSGSENMQKNTVISESAGNIIALFRPKQMKLEKDIFEANMMESANRASFNNFATIKLLNTIFPDNKDLAGKSFKMYAVKPMCPMGGSYTIDKRTGKVSNSVFGSRSNNVIKYENVKSDLFKKYFSTEEIKLELEFTKEGIKTVISVN